ncbi:hypothetical protein Bca52824_093807 [Brassica carinata]|uniref:Uncharacterized protein n=1 Tax=Brassica carinata TaxID=52824 RepID=A0A8X7P3K4_BRACI|nr:hypothetical protein Bca52824_093807 [Brassica carinata]
METQILSLKNREDIDEEEAHLKAAFGDSSDDEHLADRETTAVWERVEKINGLWLCRNFLSVHHQTHLLSAILNEGWFLGLQIGELCTE